MFGLWTVLFSLFSEFNIGEGSDRQQSDCLKVPLSARYLQIMTADRIACVSKQFSALSTNWELVCVNTEEVLKGRDDLFSETFFSGFNLSKNFLTFKEREIELCSTERIAEIRLLSVLIKSSA